MIANGINISTVRVNVLGLTFKENVSDPRNYCVPDMLDELRSFGIEVHIYDPLVEAEEVRAEYGLALHEWEDLPTADSLVVAVVHQGFREMDVELLSTKMKQGGVLVDVKACLRG